MTDARTRAWQEQEKKRQSDPEFKRTPLWLLPEDVAMLDSLGRKFRTENRMATLRKLIEIGLAEPRKGSRKR